MKSTDIFCSNCPNICDICGLVIHSQMYFISRVRNLSCADQENSVRGHQRISQRVIRTPFEKQLDQRVQLLLEGGPYQYF